MIDPRITDLPAFLKEAGLEPVVSQRYHQIHDEGFDLGHDQAQPDGTLVNAAIWFLTGDEAFCPWPGTRHVPDKKGRIDTLAKASAFLAAEIARLKARENEEASQQD
ncbi:hypothetical protein ACFOY8_15155 [Thalassospira xianhensis]|uniref:Uncharacterized protein n=1 Tax=Thalassospira xianhensis MCCC 1A02616 TaxID=1177929 RepID=A0A367UHP0_9PROT|nr:hypothetical protein [Thalassospira xianhensis]RCK07521.1 hypothetical protein TH5_00065 [Thalassospira xianhensis MCCC 1A02616]